jgi:hypothetical protein
MFTSSCEFRRSAAGDSTPALRGRRRRAGGPSSLEIAKLHKRSIQGYDPHRDPRAASLELFAAEENRRPAPSPTGTTVHLKPVLHAARVVINGDPGTGGTGHRFRQFKTASSCAFRRGASSAERGGVSCQRNAAHQQRSARRCRI